MPFKTDTLAINCPFFDRRSKLLPCQKEMVLFWHNKGFSQRKLAAMFSVSRRLITFIINPDSHTRNLECRQQRGGSSIYYKKEKHTKSIREHRQHKYKILKNTL